MINITNKEYIDIIINGEEKDNINISGINRNSLLEDLINGDHSNIGVDEVVREAYGLDTIDYNLTIELQQECNYNKEFTIVVKVTTN